MSQVVIYLVFGFSDLVHYKPAIQSQKIAKNVISGLGSTGVLVSL